jgi:hypothetical protein
LALKIVRDVLTRIENPLADFHESQFAAEPFVANGARLDVKKLCCLSNIQQVREFKPAGTAFERVAVTC